ncbi:hypothetical protein C4901_13860 [Acidiferrobacter sp. SPIII_3]|jgi:hypothetical protein|uniref:hypothetical protein n=1 Tax=Acidiferrobacter sp. SPIII_3 TaxID=1281578 RepID=UPI000D73BB49|nr:hypothetical protein [Acidiferrobacter sp. SPIII_3]AWP24277.1 hypothetical protein C4901_13860 [Acidiferrobacter sp. SPIII_3]
MLTTQHSDLVWLGKSKIPITVRLVPIRQRGGIWYRMLIEPQGTNQGALLLNRNGKPRSWRDLSAAVRFVSRTLRHVRSVTVEVASDAAIRDMDEADGACDVDR